MKKAIGLMTCALALFPSLGAAQGMTVDEIVGVALERSPVLKGARAEVDVARGDLSQARLRPNPMVGVNRREMFDDPGNATEVMVDWPLDLFRRGARAQSASSAIDVATYSIEDRERLLAAAVRAQAGRVLEAERTQAILAERLEVARQLLTLTEARVKEGASPRLDLDLLQVEVQRADGEVSLQAARVAAAAIELRRLAGLPIDSSSPLAGNLEDLVDAGPLPAGPASTTVEGRADVRQSLAMVQLAEARLEQTRRDGWPEATLTGEYARMANGFPQRAFDSRGALVPIQGLFNTLRIGVRLSVPLLDRRQGAVAAARAAQQQAHHEAEATRLAAMAEVATADAGATAARRALDLYASARAQARRNFEVIRESYGLGSATLVDALDAQQRYLDVESDYTRALGESYQARVSLRLATGDVK